MYYDPACTLTEADQRDCAGEDSLTIECAQSFLKSLKYIIRERSHINEPG